MLRRRVKPVLDILRVAGLLLAVILVLLSGCDPEPSKFYYPDLDLAIKALKDAQNQDEYPMVIVEISEPDHFFQYVWAQGEEIHIDIPEAQFRDDQKEQVAQTAEEMGLYYFRQPATDPETLEKFYHQTYQTYFSMNECEEALRTGFELFNRIGVINENSEVKIIKVWE